MTDDTARTHIEKRAERAGFLARSTDVERDQNPYVRPASTPYLDLRTDEIQRGLAAAWWRGWDKANAELSS